MKTVEEQIRDEIVNSFELNGFRLASDFARQSANAAGKVSFILAGYRRQFALNKGDDIVSDELHIIVASSMVARIIQNFAQAEDAKLKKIHDILNDKA